MKPLLIALTVLVNMNLFAATEKLHIHSGLNNTSVLKARIEKEDVFAEILELEKGLYEVKVSHHQVPVKISIEDNEGIVIFSKIYQTEGSFVRQFDLRDVGLEDLKMVIKGKRSLIFKDL